MLALSVGHSTTTQAGRSLHQPGGVSGSGQQTCPKPGGHQTAKVQEVELEVGIQEVEFQMTYSIWHRMVLI